MCVCVRACTCKQEHKCLECVLKFTLKHTHTQTHSDTHIHKHSTKALQVIFNTVFIFVHRFIMRSIKAKTTYYTRTWSTAILQSAAQCMQRGRSLTILCTLPYAHWHPHFHHIIIHNNAHLARNWLIITQTPIHCWLEMKRLPADVKSVNILSLESSHDETRTHSLPKQHINII